MNPAAIAAGDEHGKMARTEGDALNAERARPLRRAGVNDVGAILAEEAGEGAAAAVAHCFTSRGRG